MVDLLVGALGVLVLRSTAQTSNTNRAGLFAILMTLLDHMGEEYLSEVGMGQLEVLALEDLILADLDME